MLRLSSLSPPYILLIIYAAFVVSLTIRILLDNNAPEVSIAWLLAVYFLPYAGAVLYLLGGVNWKKRKIMKMLPEKTFKNMLGPILEKQEAFLRDERDKYDNDLVKNVSLAMKSGNSIITLNNRMKPYFSGRQFFDDFLKDLETAEDSIHIEMYIYRSDELGEKIFSILRRKADEGVSVRLLFDGVGCINTMSRQFRRRLKK